MPAWTDLDRWHALCTGKACPICARGEPFDVIATLSASWLTMPERAPARGYVCVVSRTHAVELQDLPESAASEFMRDLRVVSKALTKATGSVKLNCEIHGNTLPHLHAHFYPRYAGDHFGDGPITPRAVTWPVYGDGEFTRIRDAVLEAWGGSMPGTALPDK